jgi:hypothetical protein
MIVLGSNAAPQDRGLQGYIIVEFAGYLLHFEATPQDHSAIELLWLLLPTSLTLLFLVGPRLLAGYSPHVLDEPAEPLQSPRARRAGTAHSGRKATSAGPSSRARRRRDDEPI